ncbi:TolC family protein [Acidipila sp. EB88]|uniref:TolC family protein n=1 Tax=Acidipila sp. EB88 TaxID=2305226 RepID=UPI000F5DE246|nr:TolC family protein [Acidipila sp. EB88]RRA48330.1 TolC family protein [Acidipila sp. EB88]
MAEGQLRVDLGKWGRRHVANRASAMLRPGLAGALTAAVVSGVLACPARAQQVSQSSNPSSVQQGAGGAQTGSTSGGQNTELPAAPTPSPAGDSASTTTTQQGSTGGGFPVQVPNTSSLFNSFLGSVQARPVTPEVIALTLDDALRMGIENNLALVYAKQSEVQQKAQRSQVLNVLLPNIDVQGSTALHQFNLESEGFRPDILPQFSALLGGGAASSAAFPLIVKVDVTQGQANFSQYLFDWAGYDLVKAVGHLVTSTVESTASSRGQVVQNVGIAYLRVIAAEGQTAYDQALLKTDASVLYRSEQEHQAGITANLDELRSRVQYQTQQQALIQDENTLAKAKIALNRSIGLAPEQQIRVVDATPFSNLEAMNPEDAEQQALAARQDLSSSLEQVQSAELERKAATRERFPTLIFNADYGVTGISGGVYHDTWAATGTLNIPIFQEAKFRSDRDTAEFQLQNARAQAGNVRGQIRQQVRNSLIDLRAATATVRVAKSNAELSQVALDQSIERFQAGIEDNLPTTEAQSTLAQAQVQYINANFQFNQAKLNLARNLGMLDVNFHPEWRGGLPTAVLSDRAAMGR